MKKVLALIMMIALTSVVVSAGEDRPINPEQLPKEIKTFLKEHFPEQEISFAKVEKELLSTEYKVYLVGGNKIEFAKNNEWKEIDCEFTEVPTTLIPEQIKAYVNKNFSGQKITQIEKKKKGGYEIELDNSVDIEFNKAFAVIDIDY